MWFRKKKPSILPVTVAPQPPPASPQIRIVEPVNSDSQTRRYLTQISLRRGMWVRHATVAGPVIGIIKDADPTAKTVDIAVVNGKGETTAHLTVDPFSLMQAKLSEIPEPRRPDPTLGAAKGYT